MDAALPAGALSGLRVLLTRPAAEAEETAEIVRGAGGEALVYPCLALGPPADPGALAAALAERPELLALTSVNAARAVLAQRAQSDDLRGVFIAAVGERTAAALRAGGLTVDLVAPEPSAAGLFAALQAGGPPLEGRRVLFPRAAGGREELITLLEGAGARVEAVVAYRMVKVPPERLAGAVAALRRGAVDLVPLGSPRTAEVLLAALGPDGPALLRPAAVGAVGETTAATLRGAGVRVDAVAGGASFARLLLQLADRRRSP